jgi:hypothetical protein
MNDDTGILDSNFLPGALMVMFLFSLCGGMVLPIVWTATPVLFVLFLWSAARHGRKQTEKRWKR